MVSDEEREIFDVCSVEVKQLAPLPYLENSFRICRPAMSYVEINLSVGSRVNTRASDLLDPIIRDRSMNIGIPKGLYCVQGLL